MMIDSEEALRIILENRIDFGTEPVPLSDAIGRILAEDLLADRPLPPFDRVCMDGIAIPHDSFANGQRHFEVEKIGAAGQPQQTLNDSSKCIEVMTGAVLPKGTDTVIRYEDLKPKDEGFEVMIQAKPKANIHFQGEDLAKGGLLIPKGQRIKAIDINLLASVGKDEVEVKRLPKVAVISSGDELVEVNEVPEAHQIRRSNVHMILARLKELGIRGQDFHITDDREDIAATFERISADFDVLMMSGGVSKGAFDFIPAVLDELGFIKLFHGVQQRPGKPIWTGRKGNAMVFAFPGNPVSTLACFHQYVMPWLNACMGHDTEHRMKVQLRNEVLFKPDLTYFAQAKISFNEEGTCEAEVIHGHGSGDLKNPSSMDGFIVLPRGKETYSAGEVYDFIPFYPLFP
ncbi:MAG: molybdopterin molybdotransferase MoeA [Bacteroidetes bacterium]|nr:molybdopterin molybdotransferase MoeA [Bacteroidota bacterium]